MKLPSAENAFSVSMKTMSDEDRYKIGCVIMASGMGKRFGSNKLLADFCGKPMIQWILDSTEGIFEKRVIVTRHKEIAELCHEQKIHVVLHDFPGRNDTVRLGLEAIGENLDTCMFTPSDQPLLSRGTILALAQKAKKENDKIWRPAFQEISGAPVIFPAWTFPELITLPEGKGGGVVIRKYPDKVKYVQIQEKEELTDVDTPEILEKLCSIFIHRR